MYEGFDKLKKRAEDLREGIAVYSEIREKNLDYKEKADSLERFIKKFEKELSIVLFKCALVEARIRNEEKLRGIKQNNEDA